MKNIEKYEEEIKKEIANFRNIPCIVKDLKDGGCGESRNCVTCSTEMLHWLSQEYKEPILSQEGKEFLKQLIAPFISNEIVSVCKNEDLQILRIDYKIGWTCYSKKVLGEKWDWFKNLNPEKLYTLEELGLRERLKGE